MRQAIVIAGSGRSGTTWVQDSIAEANNLRTVFEPLHPKGVRTAQKFAYRFVRNGADEPELREFMDRVLSGSLRSIWANYRVRPDRFNIFRVGASQVVFNARLLARNKSKYRIHDHNGLIVKFIRANLMLPWLVSECGVNLLFVTRHPCAVIASRLKLGGGDWLGSHELELYRSDHDLVQLVADSFGVDIRGSFSPISALTCIWCIENLLPLQWAGDSGFLVTAYEDLVQSSGEEWERVVGGLGLAHVPDSTIRTLPSQQASADMRGKMFSSVTQRRWAQVLTDEQINEISDVLDAFSCSVYSVNDDRPKIHRG